MATLARVRTIFTGVAGSPWYSNLYFRDDGGTPVANAASTAVATFWGSLNAQMLQGTTYTVQPEIPRIDDTTGQIQEMTTSTVKTANSVSGAEPLPFASQGLIRWTTGSYVDGRQVRGRTFVPALLEGSNANGVPNSTLQTVMLNAANALIADAGTILVVWHRPKYTSVPGSPPVLERPGSSANVSAASVWGQWAVLRSRRD